MVSLETQSCILLAVLDDQNILDRAVRHLCHVLASTNYLQRAKACSYDHNPDKSHLRVRIKYV